MTSITTTVWAKCTIYEIEALTRFPREHYTKAFFIDARDKRLVDEEMVQYWRWMLAMTGWDAYHEYEFKITWLRKKMRRSQVPTPKVLLL